MTACLATLPSREKTGEVVDGRYAPPETPATFSANTCCLISRLTLVSMNAGGGVRHCNKRGLIRQDWILSAIVCVSAAVEPADCLSENPGSKHSIGRIHRRLEKQKSEAEAPIH